MKISAVINVHNIEEVGDSGLTIKAETKGNCVTIELPRKCVAGKLELDHEQLLGLLLRAHPRFGYNFGFVPLPKVS